MVRRSSHVLMRGLAIAGVLFGHSEWAAAELPSLSAGLLFKSGEARQESVITDKIALSQRLIVQEETWQSGGVQYVDNCPKGKTAIKNPPQELLDSLKGEGSYRVGEVRDVKPTIEGDPFAYAWFVSKTTPPAAGLRVVVRNILPGQVPEKIPYTDREYDSGIRSQGFSLSTDTKHQNKFLAVNLGTNQFAYEIKRGDQVVESGQFSVEFSQRSEPATRTVWLPKQEVDYPCSEH